MSSVRSSPPFAITPLNPLRVSEDVRSAPPSGGRLHSVPWDPRIVRMLERFPALKAIGNTPMVRVDVLRGELPEVEVLAKMSASIPGLPQRPSGPAHAAVGAG